VRPRCPGSALNAASCRSASASPQIATAQSPSAAASSGPSGALALPFLLACGSAAPLGALDAAGVALWFVGLAGESLADRQLAAFKSRSQNRGRTCREGLWSVSRHPNYFFQWLLWCAYALFALGAPFGWLGLASPAVMLALILFVTGIPPTEEQALRSRGEDYRDYQRTTSAFVPWFPGHGARKRTA